MSSRYSPNTLIFSPSWLIRSQRYFPPIRVSATILSVCTSFGPHHSFSCTGSVHARKTRSRGALMNRLISNLVVSCVFILILKWRILGELRQVGIHEIPRLCFRCEDVHLRTKPTQIVQTRGFDADKLRSGITLPDDGTAALNAKAAVVMTAHCAVSESLTVAAMAIQHRERSCHAFVTNRAARTAALIRNFHCTLTHTIA